MFDLFKFLLNVGLWFIEHLPELDFSIPDDIVSNASSILSNLAWFIPIGSLITLFNVKLLILTVRLGISILKFIKSFIPFISGG